MLTHKLSAFLNVIRRQRPYPYGFPAITNYANSLQLNGGGILSPHFELIFLTAFWGGVNA